VRGPPPGSFLVDAIVSGDVMRAQGAVMAGVDVNSTRDDRGFTALHLAAMRGIGGLTNLMLQHRADVDAIAGTQHLTALHLAAMGGHTTVQRLLLEGRADASLRTSEGLLASALARGGSRRRVHRAEETSRRRGKQSDSMATPALKEVGGQKVVKLIHRGDILLAQGMVLAGADCNAGRDANGKTALHVAASQGLAGLARLLISKAAEINATTMGLSRSALHLGVLHGHTVIVRLLLEARSEVNLADAEGETPLSLSVLDGNLAIVQHLVEAGAVADDVDASTTAARRNADSSKAGALNITTSTDASASHARCLEDSFRATLGSPQPGSPRGDGSSLFLADSETLGLEPEWCSEILPESPCSSNAPVSSSASAACEPRAKMSVLARALQSNNDKEVIEQIVGASGGVATADTQASGPPLLMAAQHGNMRVARFLLESRADPDGHDQSLQTSMHFAAKNGASRLIKMLVDSRAEVNSQDREGMLPVQYSLNRATERQLYQFGSRKAREGPWHTGAKLSTSMRRVSSPASCPVSGPSSPSQNSPARNVLSSPLPSRSARGNRAARPTSRTKWTGQLLAHDRSFGTSINTSLQTTAEPSTPKSLSRCVSSAWTPPSTSGFGRSGSAPSMSLDLDRRSVLVLP